MRTDLDRRIADLNGLQAPDLRDDIVRRAELPEDRSPEVAHGSGRPLRRLAAALIALLVFSAGLWFLRAAFELPEAVDTPTPPPAPDLWGDLERGVLTSMPDPPFLRQGSAVASGPDGLLMWGGRAGDGRPNLDDGVFFDVLERAWRPVAPAPLSARTWTAAVWAGDRFVVWSGATGEGPGLGPLDDGATYDPSADTWTPLPAAPNIGHVPLTAAWTGEEVVFAGGYDGETSALAYSPSAGSWRVLPDMPIAFTRADAVWTGREVVVFGAYLAPGNHPKTPATGTAYDPATDSWRLLPDSDLSPNSNGIVWDGERLVAMDYELRVAALDPVGGDWVDLPRLPTNVCEGFLRWVAEDGSVLVEACGELAELSPGAGRWHVLVGRGSARYPLYVDPHVAGGAFLLIGSSWPDESARMFAMAPSLEVGDADAAWDVAAAFAALRSHYPYDPDNVGEEILAQLESLISPFALTRYEDRSVSQLHRLWAYYYGFEVLDVVEVAPVDDGTTPITTYVVRVRFTADEPHVERLTIGPGPALDGNEHGLVILDAVDGALVTEPGPYVLTENGRRVATLVRGQVATFAAADGVETIRCADELVDVPPAGGHVGTGWVAVTTHQDGEVDASCTGP